MSIEKPQNLNSQENEPMGQNDFLASLNRITDEDIQALRDSIPVEYTESIKSFDERDDLAILALLFKMSDEEIKDFIKLAVEKKFLMGIHSKLKSSLVTLRALTDDEKYIELWHEAKGEMAE